MNLKDNINLRRATKDDAQKLLIYFRDLAEEGLVDFPLASDELFHFLGQADRLIEDYESRNSVCLIAELAENQNIVGVATCKGEPFKASIHIVNFSISVRKEYRNRGIGKTLVKSVIHWARECGVKKIELEVGEANKVAVLLYKSFGFFSEGLRQKTFLKNGKYWNTIRMSLFID